MCFHWEAADTVFLFLRLLFWVELSWSYCTPTLILSSPPWTPHKDEDDDYVATFGWLPTYFSSSVFLFWNSSGNFCRLLLYKVEKFCLPWYGTPHQPSITTDVIGSESVSIGNNHKFHISSVVCLTDDWLKSLFYILFVDGISTRTICTLECTGSIYRYYPGSIQSTEIGNLLRFFWLWFLW